MSKIRIRVEDISKSYNLGELGIGTLSQDLTRFWAKLQGKEDPFALVGDENDRTLKSDNDFVYALKDISFDVKEGEVLGIIGRNGAGKSTLLKILSKVTGPSTGSIKINGRIGSLLEVGTGMHPELTGIENIYLNGAILGMTKKEIGKKIDEIVAFAGIAKYADTPFKRYSSGMRVRLGFAVAAFLEPEILIVDEVLAVGDAEFQKQAIGKMKEVSKGQGRTVLFVSHNMASIEKLCTRAIVLDKGGVSFSGKVEDAIANYLAGNSVRSSFKLDKREDRKGGVRFRFTDYIIENDKGEQLVNVCSGMNIRIRMFYQSEQALKNIVCRIQILTKNGEVVTTLNNYHCDDPFKEIGKSGSVVCIIPNLPFFDGSYDMTFSCLENMKLIDHIENAGELNVQEGDFFGTGRIPVSKQGVLVRNHWANEE